MRSEIAECPCTMKKKAVSSLDLDHDKNYVKMAKNQSDLLANWYINLIRILIVSRSVQNKSLTIKHFAWSCNINPQPIFHNVIVSTWPLSIMLF